MGDISISSGFEKFGVEEVLPYITGDHDHCQYTISGKEQNTAVELTVQRCLKSNFFFLGNFLLECMDTSFPSTRRASSKTSCVMLIYPKEKVMTFLVICNLSAQQGT